MAYKILFTEDALSDLEQILDKIRTGGESAAEIFGGALLDHIELLRDFPRIGTLVAQRTDVRRIVHSPVLIYYRLNEARVWSRFSISGTESENLQEVLLSSSAA